MEIIHIIVASVLGLSTAFLVSSWFGIHQYTSRIDRALKETKEEIKSMDGEIKENDDKINAALEGLIIKSNNMST